MKTLARMPQMLVLALVLGSCADEALIGENRSPGGSTTGNGANSDCEQGQPLEALPREEPTYSASPSLWVDTARGRWRNDAGDVLEVRTFDAATRFGVPCNMEAPDATTDQTPRSDLLSAIAFEFRGVIMFATVDGAWNESVEVVFRLNSATAGSDPPLTLRGSGRLALKGMQGTFSLSTEPPEMPVDYVSFALNYQGNDWILSRFILREGGPSDDGAAGQASSTEGVVWSAPPLMFVRDPS
jgi:hypothetical protein